MTKIVKLSGFSNVGPESQILHHTKESQKEIIKQIYDSEAIQKRINEAAKIRVRLDYEVKQRYEDLKHKHINLLG